MRLTAMIVDDESKVGKLVEHIIEWEKLDLQCIATVDNGATAYNIISQYHPDIVITDIRMPGMDGLELIRKTLEENISTKFVVISGYRYFEYAHNALKYGVEDYLLKPINKEELNDVLSKICEKSRMVCEQKANMIKITQEVRKSRDILQKEFIDSLMLPNANQQTMEKVFENYGFVFSEACFQAIVIKLDKKRIEIEITNQDKLVMDKVIEIMRSELTTHVTESILTHRDSLLIIGVFNFKSENKSHIRKAIAQLFSKIKAYITEFEIYEPTLGIGAVENDFFHLKNSIGTALQAIKYRIVVGTGKRISLSEHVFDEIIEAKSLVEIYKSELVNATEVFDEAKLVSIIHVLFEKLSKTRTTNPCRYYSLADEIVLVFFETLGTNRDEENREVRELLQDTIQNTMSVMQLQYELCQVLCRLLNQRQASQMVKLHKPVREAQKYLKKHYSEKIVLEDLVELVDLNPVYFSVIFKKETGTTITDYLIQLRIEAAKEMLRDTNDTIAAISENIGYKDTKYFSQLFQKIVGVKPSQYRKLYS